MLFVDFADQVILAPERPRGRKRFREASKSDEDVRKKIRLDEDELNLLVSEFHDWRTGK